MIKMKAARLTEMSVKKGLILNSQEACTFYNTAVEVINPETSLFAPPDEVERLKSVCFQV